MPLVARHKTDRHDVVLRQLPGYKNLFLCVKSEGEVFSIKSHRTGALTPVRPGSDLHISEDIAARDWFEREGFEVKEEDDLRWS